MQESEATDTGRRPSALFPIEPVWALVVFDDGSGAALCVGGSFPIRPAGDSFLARWSTSSLCVKAPTQRLGAQVSGGTSAPATDR
jgi:hypothetical protein